MIVIPAIDLSNGACVRLRQGDFDTKTTYSTEPVTIARQFEASGASWLHVVDLDGAKDGSTRQTSIVLSVATETSLKVQVGGGLRSRSDVDALLSGGVERVVLGSLAVDDPETVKAWLEEFGPERIVLAFDVRLHDGEPYPAVRGWQHQAERTLSDVLADYAESGLRHVLCTDIHRDGMLSGPNLELYAALVGGLDGMAVQASGGVAALDDLKRLRACGVSAVVVGKALYEGRFELAEALAC